MRKEPKIFAHDNMLLGEDRRFLEGTGADSNFRLQSITSVPGNKE